MFPPLGIFRNHESTVQIGHECSSHGSIVFPPVVSVLKRSVNLKIAEQMINKIYPFAVFAFDWLAAVFADVHACPPHCSAMALAMPRNVFERSLL